MFVYMFLCLRVCQCVCFVYIFVSQIISFMYMKYVSVCACLDMCVSVLSVSLAAVTADPRSHGKNLTNLSIRTRLPSRAECLIDAHVRNSACQPLQRADRLA